MNRRTIALPILVIIGPFLSVAQTPRYKLGKPARAEEIRKKRDRRSLGLNRAAHWAVWRNEGTSIRSCARAATAKVGKASANIRRSLEAKAHSRARTQS